VISPGDRVSDVLARDETLVDVFAAASPAFERLRNPVMRKLMARLVTVEQAARVASVDPEALVARLNQALAGGAVSAPEPAMKSRATSPRPAWLENPGARPVVELDVRDDLRAGREPFHAVMRAVRSLPADGIFALRAIFEPVPLYKVLAAMGFAHHTEVLADDDYRVWFHRDGSAPGGAPDPSAPTPDDPHVVVLDVRGLEPPEPMVRTLEALEALPADGVLVQVNVRVPQFLLPKLAERGFVHEIQQQSPDLVHLFIRHAPKENTAMTATELDVRAIPPRDKHPTIFRTFDALATGESFVLVNDHDPRPLRYQFEAERNGQYSWNYVESGPAVWRVAIAKR
jgi:uncharacterized protein (DUF2249 family)/TusA-related sulfurtransferase